MCPENNTYGYAVVMKLKELDYKNLYFKNQKDKYNMMYGHDVDISKIGFTTSGQSRNQILTKLEQVLRNNEIKTYSSRLYEELKTFIWSGTKAQAQKGYNDDLVMSLAIGVWLYDTSPVHSKHTHDINKAMLSAFAVNSNAAKDSVISPWADTRINPFKPLSPPDAMFHSGSANPHGDLSWLL